MFRGNIFKIMISEVESSFPNASQGLQIYSISEVQETHPSSSLHYSLSILKEKVHQVESLITLFTSQDQTHYDSSSLAISSINSLIQEIVFTASSMLLTSQQMPPSGSNSCDMINPDEFAHHRHFSSHRISDGSHGQEFYPSETTSLNWYALESFNNGGPSNNCQNFGKKKEGIQNRSPKHDDIIELEAADLLAKYTHYCQVCGKGFKRDANLRMHMRAHGDEYKTSEALSNPMKNNEIWKKRENFPGKFPSKYSCPQEGCRWNRKHAKFQPLKSMICVKNHYKRSHCPKMYICKRCNKKQFSVLSDLKTHEKHCGDQKWQCSCGTTFSRKDKLMGHVALFIGHSPLMSSVMKPRKSESKTIDYSQIV